MRPQHRSFRLTPPAYMEGRRVKPRLKWLVYGGSCLSVAVMLLAYAAAVYFVFPLDGPAFGRIGGMVGPIAVLLIALVSYFLTMIGFRWLAVRLGWMTPNESKGFFLTEHSRWPEAWLEPLAGQREPGDH